MTAFECFDHFIHERLSNAARKLWNRVRVRHSRYRSLHQQILDKVRDDSGTKSRAQIEAESIKGIVDYEVELNTHDANWSFTDGGLNSLADDFFLLNEYLSSAGNERLRKWAITFGKYLLPKEEVSTLDAISDADTRADKITELVKPLIEPLWSFFVAMCHAIQTGENELTAVDAYWLGLVDEVVGDSELLSLRDFIEYRADPPEPPPDPALAVVQST